MPSMAAGFTSAGEVGNALHLGGAADYARLPNIMQAGLDFGSGSFAFDAWVNVAAGTAGPRVIAEKRELVSTSPYRTRGWALYLDGQQCKLEIGTSEMTETFAGPILPADTPCLRCIWPEPPPPGASETCDTAGILGPQYRPAQV